MHIFVTSEATIDIPRARKLSLMRLEEFFNIIAKDVDCEIIKDVGIICIIMNPEIANPFPPGFIHRHSRKALDLKVSIDYSAWVLANDIEQYALVDAGVNHLVQTSKVSKTIRQDVDTFLELLKRSVKAASDELRS